MWDKRNDEEKQDRTGSSKNMSRRTPVVYFSQLAKGQKGSGHPKGGKTRAVSAFSTGEAGHGHNRPATIVGAPAKRIDARQDSTNERSTDSPEVSHAPSNTGEVPGV